MKPYPLQLEIAGPIALWARPDTMPNPVSYVAPSAEPKPLRAGEVRFCDGTTPCETNNHAMPAFLEMVFDQPQNGVNANPN